MNYEPWPTHHPGTVWPINPVPNPPCDLGGSYNSIYPPPQPNRFIYVKQNLISSNPPSQIHVNPHFRPKVYVNPQFKPQFNDIQKPKIHVNPNVLRNLTAPPKTEAVKTQLEIKVSTRTIISTKNKLVRVPCKEIVKDSPKDVRKKRHSLHTKYKIVRSSSISADTSSSNIKPVPSVIHRFKLDKRPSTGVVRQTSTSNKKKYVFINNLMSISEMAKHTILKRNSNTRQSNVVKINGILYKKSPNSLKRQLDSPNQSLSKTTIQSKYKLVRKPTKGANISIKSKLDDNRKSIKSITKYKLVRKPSKGANVSIKSKLDDSRKSLLRRYKLIRTKDKPVKITPNKLRKCNIPCSIYRKFGKCKGRDNETCIRVHDPNQIVLCTKFLQGACIDKNCLLSHAVSLEKMPTCKYYLEGLCSRDDCSYLHVKISPKADICVDFLRGFCKEGAQCNKRHQFLCPEYEKTKSCSKKRCPYPHGSRRVRKRKLNVSLAKKCSVKKDVKITKTNIDGKPPETVPPRKAVPVKAVTNRYYDDLEGANKNESVENTNKISSKGSRPKLGSLPSFIPLFEDI